MVPAMKSAVSGHGKSCSPQNCLNLNSIPPPDSKRPLHISFFSLAAYTMTYKQGGNRRGCRKALPRRQAGTSLPQSYSQRKEVSSDCQHTREWEDLGWHSHTFLFAWEGRAALCAQWSLNSWASERSGEITGVRQEAFQRWWKAERATHPFETQVEEYCFRDDTNTCHQETEGKQGIKERGRSRTVCSQYHSNLLGSFWAQALGALTKI